MTTLDTDRLIQDWEDGFDSLTPAQQTKRQMWMATAMHLRQLRAQNRIYRCALEFYAAEKHMMLSDDGRIAKSALHRAVEK